MKPKFLRKIFSPDLKVITGPTVILVITGILFIIIINFGYRNVLDKVESYKTTKKSQNGLDAKYNTLKNLSVGTLDKSNRLVVILPDENMGAIVISQLRKKTTEFSLTLSGINLNSEEDTDNKIKQMKMSFDVAGANAADIVSFLETLPTLAPLIEVKQVKIDQQSDFVAANIEALIFWSPFPETLPSLTEPVTDLTEEENKLYAALAGYTLPDNTEGKASEPVDRESPFY